MKISARGFSLIELLIVIGIIAILTTIAFPQYKNYTNKAQVMADISGIDAYKLGVAVCYNLLGTFTGCDAGVDNIPAIGGKVASVVDGKIQINVTYASVAKIVQYQGVDDGGTIAWEISSDITDCENILKGCSSVTSFTD
jgi:prepilin-type N-terminal cleavage/methylation domain-containing protein